MQSSIKSTKKRPVHIFLTTPLTWQVRPSDTASASFYPTVVPSTRKSLSFDLTPEKSSNPPPIQPQAPVRPRVHCRVLRSRARKLVPPVRDNVLELATVHPLLQLGAVCGCEHKSDNVSNMLLYTMKKVKTNITDETKRELLRIKQLVTVPATTKSPERDVSSGKNLRLLLRRTKENSLSRMQTQKSRLWHALARTITRRHRSFGRSRTLFLTTPNASSCSGSRQHTKDPYRGRSVLPALLDSRGTKTPAPRSKSTCRGESTPAGEIVRKYYAGAKRRVFQELFAPVLLPVRELCATIAD